MTTNLSAEKEKTYEHIETLRLQAKTAYLSALAILDGVPDGSGQAAWHIAAGWYWLARSIAQLLDMSHHNLTVLEHEGVSLVLKEAGAAGLAPFKFEQWQDSAAVVYQAAAAVSRGELAAQASGLNSAVEQQLLLLEAAVSILRKHLAHKFKKGVCYWIAANKLLTLAAGVFTAAFFYFAVSVLFQSYRPACWVKNCYGKFVIVNSTQSWGVLNKDRSVEGFELSVAGKKYASGLGTHANSTIELTLPSGYRLFKGLCGIAHEVNPKGSIVCKVEINQQVLFTTPILRGDNQAAAFEVPLNGAQRVVLKIEDAGDNIEYDHANWLDLELVP